MTVDELRISKLRVYLLSVIDSILNNQNSKINANMLSNDIDNYSLDKIPVQSQIRKWIIGTTINRDLYSFRSRVAYSQDTINNLKNVGFFELFEETINSNNREGILPDIEGIESIECLNCGTMNFAETNTAEFDIQIQITYRKEIKGNGIST